MSEDINAVANEIADKVAAKFAVTPEQFAALTNYQPGTRSVTPGGIKLNTGGLIGSMLFPSVVAVPDGQELAAYPSFSNAHLATAVNDIVTIQGTVQETDVAITWTPVALDVHAKATYIDPREARAAAAAGIDIYASKLDLVKIQTELKKEVAAATVATTALNYAVGNSDTAAQADRWNETGTSDPVAYVAGKTELVRSLVGSRPTLMWMGAEPFYRLSIHPKVLSLFRNVGTKPGFTSAPLTPEELSLIFRMKVVVGDGVHDAGGGVVDVWGKDFGLAYVPENVNLFSPAFGMNLTAAGFPKVVPFRNELKGAEGSEGLKFVDAYKHVITLDTAGWLTKGIVA
jgi:hypothetical protein